MTVVVVELLESSLFVVLSCSDNYFASLVTALTICTLDYFIFIKIRTILIFTNNRSLM